MINIPRQVSTANLLSRGIHHKIYLKPNGGMDPSCYNDQPNSWPNKATLFDQKIVDIEIKPEHGKHFHKHLGS